MLLWLTIVSLTGTLIALHVPIAFVILSQLNKDGRMSPTFVKLGCFGGAAI